MLENLDPCRHALEFNNPAKSAARVMLLRMLRALLRVFFRRVEVVGGENVPATGATVFAPNHPNSLLDPLVLFACVPRPVATLAAEPLFRKPVLGTVMRSIGTIPVYRREDGADRSKNRDTFAAARAHLAKGGAIAIFPEGVSHDDPSLRPLRTGAARIALGVSGVTELQLVPVGLFYTARARFRSEVLLCFGQPIVVTPSTDVLDGEPPTEVVQSLTAQLEAALGRLVLQADQRKALQLVTEAERIFTTAETGTADLQTILRRRRRMVDEYARLKVQQPERVRELEARVRRYHRWLKATGLNPEHLPPAGYRPFRVAGMIVIALVALVVLLPLAVLGIVIHLPAWHLTRWIAQRMHARSGRGEDVLATMKLTVGLILYPLTWLGVAALGWWSGGVRSALTAGILAPITGALALRFRTRLQNLTATLRGILLALFGTRFYRQLLAERRSLYQEFLSLDNGSSPLRQPSIEANRREN